MGSQWTQETGLQRDGKLESPRHWEGRGKGRKGKSRRKTENVEKVKKKEKIRRAKKGNGERSTTENSAEETGRQRGAPAFTGPQEEPPLPPAAPCSPSDACRVLRTPTALARWGQHVPKYAVCLPRQVTDNLGWSRRKLGTCSLGVFETKSGSRYGSACLCHRVPLCVSVCFCV